MCPNTLCSKLFSLPSLTQISCAWLSENKSARNYSSSAILRRTFDLIVSLSWKKLKFIMPGKFHLIFLFFELFWKCIWQWHFMVSETCETCKTCPGCGLDCCGASCKCSCSCDKCKKWISNHSAYIVIISHFWWFVESTLAGLACARPAKMPGK